MRAIFGIVAIGLSLIACGATRISTARYIVTTAPIAVRVGHSVGLCIAVDPADPQGVWWWEPAPAGCAGRSTGPGVFRAEQATVAPSQSGAIHVRFRLQLITGPGSTRPPFADVALVLEAGSMRAPATGARVATAGRNDLDVPGPIK